MKAKETPVKNIKRLQLDQTQVTLLLSFVTVGLVLAFGTGFIIGMWYQTNESMSSLQIEPATQAPPPTSVSDNEMTFYSTLTRSPGVSAAERSDTKDVREVPPPSPPPPRQSTPSPPSASKLRYSVQVGSFRARDEAERLYAVLSKKDYMTVIKTALVPDKGIVYRVLVGQFASRDAAQRVAQRLKSRERLAVMVTSTVP